MQGEIAIFFSLRDTVRSTFWKPWNEKLPLSLFQLLVIYALSLGYTESKNSISSTGINSACFSDCYLEGCNNGYTKEELKYSMSMKEKCPGDLEKFRAAAFYYSQIVEL